MLSYTQKVPLAALTLLLPGVARGVRLTRLSPSVLMYMPELSNVLLGLLLLCYLMGAIRDYAAFRPVQAAGLA